MTDSLSVGIPQRTVERARGCWNCTHWDNGPLALQQYKVARAQAIAHMRASPRLIAQRIGDLTDIGPGFHRRVGQLVEQGRSERDAVEIVLRENRERLDQHLYARLVHELRWFDQAAKDGEWGLCLAGKVQSTFVHSLHLCEDGWTGRQGASVATEGAPLDKTPGELYSILGK